MKRKLNINQKAIIENGRTLLDDFAKQKKSIETQTSCGIITAIDAANEIDMIIKKEYKIKKEMVLSVHITEKGEPRKIVYQESKDLWCTIMPDKKKIYAKSEASLIDKLFEKYDLTIKDYSIAGIFKLALEEKIATTNCNEYTAESDQSYFDKYINDTLSKKDIRKITKADLKRYTQELVNTVHPNKKSFFKYKSVLNLIFRYAVEYDIIPTNPVDGIRNNVYYKSCAVTKAKSEEKILTQDEIKLVQSTVRKYMTYETYKGYFINGYAILLSIETGMRAGELPALKWSDVDDHQIHIHAQQLSRKREGGKEYYYAPWTKNEKGQSFGGRYFPLTDKLKSILSELKELQEKLGVESEYILCHEDGDWIKTDAYETCLRRMLTSLNFPITNNHAFRMSLNSNVFIPLGIPVTDRARMLGHSVETNLRFYSYAGKDNIDDICNLLNTNQ